MGCEGMNNLICAVVDGEATPEEETKLREHMASCSECRSRFEAFSAVSNGLGSMRAEPPELLSKGVMYRIGLETGRKKRMFSGWGRFTGLAAVLLIIVAIGVSLPRFFGGMGSQSASDSALEAAENGVMSMTAAASGKADDESLRGDADSSDASGDTGAAPESDTAPNPDPEATSEGENAASGENYGADDGTILVPTPSVSESLQKVLDELGGDTDKYSIIYLYNSGGVNNPASVAQLTPIREENGETWYALTLADIDKRDEFSDTYYTGADSEAVLVVVIPE